MSVAFRFEKVALIRGAKGDYGTVVHRKFLTNLLSIFEINLQLSKTMSTTNRNTIVAWNSQWLAPVTLLAKRSMLGADPGHGIDHMSRVVRNASEILLIESADCRVVFPAAWLHDCVLVAKNSPDRSSASRLAADHAMNLLREIDYPAVFLDAVHHAILAHSFSANVPCESIEAMVVQDADRLEALGAIGIARCLMTTGHLQQNLYNIEEPFPVTRIADDRQFAVDHFFCKLLRLPATMKTNSGKAIATARLSIMQDFLRSLSEEIGCEKSLLEASLHKLR